MPKWEYQTWNAGMYELENYDYLNEEGKKGWELTGVVTELSSHCFIFKRQIPTTPPAN